MVYVDMVMCSMFSELPDLKKARLDAYKCWNPSLAMSTLQVVQFSSKALMTGATHGVMGLNHVIHIKY